MVSPNDPFWTFNFDDAYFDLMMTWRVLDGVMIWMSMTVIITWMSMTVIMTCTGADTDSDYDSKEEKFWIVFPLVGKMVAYFQRHYDKRPMRTSILCGKDYMAKVRDGNPTNCHDMFCVTLDLFYHLVDELKQHGYLKEGKGMYVQEVVAIFLYIVGHNTRMRPVGDRFQHSTETVSCQFCRVLRAIHTYGQHLIKPDSNSGRPFGAYTVEQQIHNFICINNRRDEMCNS